MTVSIFCLSCGSVQMDYYLHFLGSVNDFVIFIYFYFYLDFWWVFIFFSFLHISSVITFNLLHNTTNTVQAWGFSLIINNYD